MTHKTLAAAILIAVAVGAPAEEAMTITSPEFEHGDEIPTRYSCKGLDISPPLAWSGAPEGTVSYALICDDPDAPIGTWVHWVFFDIPADVIELGEDVPKGANPEAGGVQGRNSWRRNSYGGPCPPRGTHRYYFRLYALDTMLELRPRAKKKHVLSAIEGHVLAEAELMGTFSK